MNKKNKHEIYMHIPDSDITQLKQTRKQVSNTSGDKSKKNI